MKFKIKYVLVTVFLISFKTGLSFGQLSFSYYSSISYSRFGIGYDFSKRVWSDFRMYGGLTFSEFTPELVVFYNVLSNDNRMLYAGLGGSINKIYGIMAPIGLRINTSEFINKTAIHIEIEPTYDIENERGIFYCSFGIRYIFRKE